MQKDETARRKCRSHSSHETQRAAATKRSTSCIPELHTKPLTRLLPPQTHWVRRQLCPSLSAPHTGSISCVTQPLTLSHANSQCWISPCVITLCFSLWEKWFLPEQHGPASPVCPESKRWVNHLTAEDNPCPWHPFTQLNCPNPCQDIHWYCSVFLPLFSHFPTHIRIFKMLVLLPRALLLLHLFVICITLLKSPANAQCKPLLWHFFTLSPYYREKKKYYLNQENNFLVLILKLLWNLNKSGKGHLFTLRQELIWS